jgi:hypothetical protein
MSANFSIVSPPPAQHPPRRKLGSRWFTVNICLLYAAANPDRRVPTAEERLAGKAYI